jgi:hypothetical protein
MSLNTPAKNDLVISMTVAEIFLLLLFGVGYGYRHQLEGDNQIERLKDEVGQLRAEKGNLSRALTESKLQIVDLQKRLTIWRMLFPHMAPEKTPGISASDVCKEACRSHASCDLGNNVLVDATVVQGHISIRVLLESERLKTWYEANNLPYPAAGSEINSPAAIQAFLGNLTRFYRDSAATGPTCRYDYRLHYASKVDGWDGRALFEKYLYPYGMYPLGAAP